MHMIALLVRIGLNAVDTFSRDEPSAENPRCFMEEPGKKTFTASHIPHHQGILGALT